MSLDPKDPRSCRVVEKAQPKDPEDQHVVRVIKGLRAENAQNPVINVRFQTKLPEGVSVEDFARAIKAVLNKPLFVPNGNGQFMTVYEWVECLDVARSRSTR